MSFVFSVLDVMHFRAASRDAGGRLRAHRTCAPRPVGQTTRQKRESEEVARWQPLLGRLRQRFHGNKFADWRTKPFTVLS